MFIAYTYEIDSAARWLIAKGLGGHIDSQENFEKMEQDTRVRVYIYS